MGLLDEALKQFTQGSQQGGTGNQPLIAIFQELLVGKPQGGNQPTPQQQASVPQASSAQAGGGQDAGSLGGLGGLLAQLQAAGLDNVVKSWIGTGQNQPVQPDELGDALGKKTVTQMADKAGCSQDDLLTQLSKALPGLIDKLTHDGRIP
ncbi:MAG: YidB family protein, partial [Hyphomicrobium sp.]|nr:YidB family protein [Hyphomicrobium sp.]